eukprot:COSAG04_NODE_53_length_30631_cov_16.782261_1_plen_122_part_10
MRASAGGSAEGQKRAPLARGGGGRRGGGRGRPAFGPPGVRETTPAPPPPPPPRPGEGLQACRPTPPCGMDGPAAGQEYALRLGQSFSRDADRRFHALRYDFKPASILHDEAHEGSLRVYGDK